MKHSRNASLRRRLTWSAVALGLGLATGATSAIGADQTASLQQLRARIDDAELQAGQIQAHLTVEEERAGSTRVAQLFGESDEEKAARLQREQNQDSSIATLNQRVGDLEVTLRQLTGQVEQLDHRLSELNDRMTRMQKDFDYKLCSLAAQQLGATSPPGDQNALPCSPTGQTIAPPPAAAAAGAQTGNANSGTVHLAPPPGVLGTLPQSAVDNPPQPEGAGTANQAASVDARPQFDAAMNLLAKAQYDEASAAFRSFADTYSKDDLAPQAVYWVGDIAYVQKNYADAARAFAEELKKYATSPRAPESMLKLGQSLIAMNQKKEGCTALGALESRYPTASKTVVAQALAVRKTAGCR